MIYSPLGAAPNESTEVLAWGKYIIFPRGTGGQHAYFLIGDFFPLQKINN